MFFAFELKIFPNLYIIIIFRLGIIRKEIINIWFRFGFFDLIFCLILLLNLIQEYFILSYIMPYIMRY